MSLREAVPEGAVHQPIAPPIPPLAPFSDFLQNVGLSPPGITNAQETPQQRRRRLLQAAKKQAVDHHWSITGTVTAEMRAAAKLAIEHELRDEPLEEFPIQEVTELAEGLRDRVYTTYRRRQEKETRRTQEVDARKRADQRADERQHTERTKKKVAFLKEARRRVLAWCKTRSVSPAQRIQVLEEVLTQLDEGLIGTEPLSEVYAAIEAVLEAHIADWDAYEAAREAKRNEEWWELATGVVVLIALGVICVKGPEIFQWLLKIFSPEPATNSESAPRPTPTALGQASDEQRPRPPVRRMRHPPQSPATEPPTSPSNADRANPFL